jgi:hypothetical protein
LEGTDCSSKPWPYGSICVAGQCEPFNPEEPIVPTYGSDGQPDNPEKEDEADEGGQEDARGNSPSPTDTPTVF